jgi:predicted MFS family arabinose efflux permease
LTTTPLRDGAVISAKRAAHRALAVLLVIYAVAYMDRQLVAILIEPIKRDLAMTDTAAGLLYGFAFVVFFSVLGIPIARRADRSNRSHIIIASLALFSAMTALSASAATYWQLVLARIGVGIGEAGTSPPSQSIIADLYPVERRGTAMAVFAVGLHVGILLGFFAGGVIGQFLGWRATFLIAGAAGLLMALVAALVLKEPARPSISQGAGSPQGITILQAVKALWRIRSLRHVFAGATVANIAITALLAWLPSFLIRSHGLSLSRTGILLAVVIGVLGGFGTLLGGSLADRLGARDPAWRLRCIVVAFLVAAPCWAMALTAANKIAALVGLIVAGALIAFHVGPTLASVQTLAPRDIRALAASLLVFLANIIGVGCGPLLIGVLSDAWLAQYGVQSLRAALLIATPLFVWAAVHYEVASRTLTADLCDTDESAVTMQPSLDPPKIAPAA